MEANKAECGEQPVRVGQRIALNGRVGTVCWRGPVAAGHLQLQDSKRCYRGSLAYSNDSCALSDGEEPEEQQVEMLGVEWDEWRRGVHNGTLGGVFYFRPERIRCYQDAMDKIREIYSEHEQEWIRENSVANQSAVMLTNYGDTPCSFVAEKDVTRGISMEEAVHMRYMTDDIAVIESGTHEFSPHGKGRIGHEFVGRSDALKFFRETSNLLLLGLQDCGIDRVGDCSGYNFPRVQELYLTNNLISSWSVAKEVLKIMPSLETLDMSGNYLTSVGDPPLESAKLSTLLLNRTLVKFEKALEMTAKLPTLTTLGLCQNAYTDLPCIGSLPKLESLDVTGNSIWNWYSVLRLIHSSPSLKKLTVSGNQLSDLCVDSASGKSYSIYEAALEIGKGDREPLRAFGELEELYLDDNCIYDWTTVGNLAVVFPNLRALRFKLCELGKESSQATISVHRQGLIAIFPALKVLNGSDISKYDRINAERYYLTLEHLNSPVFKFTNHPEGLALAHSTRLEEIHGQREAPPDEREILLSRHRTVKVVLVPDADSASFLKPVVTRRLPLSMTIFDLKVMCSKLYDIPLSDVVLVYNSGVGSPGAPKLILPQNMPISEAMTDQDAELDIYGIDDGYTIRVQSRQVYY
ncbi:hypothetical protein, putative [Babesia caballi]|uniref:CAP-Gly domain-containing protein n=1 Tax=Babesia caballi TaxID=5871 RepID=A0AAV4LV20_BABCB|nr:hypothetical protein, putative [Babesia caballi]